jgi:hypothetical protein
MADAAPTDFEAASGFRDWIADFPWSAWLASGIVHGGLLLVISLLIVPPEHLMWLTGQDEGPPLEEMSLEELPFDDVPVPGGELGPASLGPMVEGDEVSLPGPVTGTIGNVRTGPANSGALIDGASEGDLNPLATAGEFAGGEFNVGLEPLMNPLATRGGGLEGRKFENRLAAAIAGGGSRETEQAVELGLAWLAEHQFPDGGWRFDLSQHPRCAGACSDSGSYESTTSSTGLALLSFLGAGYTHKEGKYAEVVSRGLYYLSEHMVKTSHGGDLRDNGEAPDMQLGLELLRGARRRPFGNDTMYSHGIATLAITEAYAMTGDSTLRDSAEQAVRFIINAQYDDGGWRYAPAWESPGPGDMTVTGWQLAALKSAMLAGIEVPYEVWTRASEFIDGLQGDDGARYAYVGNERGTAATTAIGLLCRMIGGWPRDSRPLQRGAALIASAPPRLNNVYFIYYASQVLHHLGGTRWTKWNKQMREYLVDMQVHDGHETGSWYIHEEHSSTGGRLYTTAMAIMTLEVYYRYMPLYGESFVEKQP